VKGPADDSFSTIEALCETTESGKLDDLTENNINCVILYDNEEVGSVSHQGAESNLLPSFVERIAALDDYKGIGYHQLLANSFLISADAGHAVSPSFSCSSIDYGRTRIERKKS
jgi:aspartyl aminopeptidase